MSCPLMESFFPFLSLIMLLQRARGQLKKENEERKVTSIHPSLMGRMDGWISFISCIIELAAVFNPMLPFMPAQLIKEMKEMEAEEIEEIRLTLAADHYLLARQQTQGSRANSRFLLRDYI